MEDSYGIILGLLIVGLLMGIVLVFCGVIFYLQYMNRRALEGKALATIVRNSGEREDMLLKVRADHLIEPGGGKLKGFNKTLMIRPDKSFKTWWPFGRPRLLQAHINSFFYSEGNPEPWDPFDRPVVINDEVLGNLQNVNFSRAMVGRSEEIVTSQQPKAKQRPSMWLWIILGACALGIVSLLYFVFIAGGG